MPRLHTTIPLHISDNIEKVQKSAFRIIYPDVDYTDALGAAQCKRSVDSRCRKFKIAAICCIKLTVRNAFNQ